jgi:alpha-glucuronidase
LSVSSRLSLIPVLLLFPAVLYAETGYEMWLRYAPLDEASARRYRETLPAAVSTLSEAPAVRSAGQELIIGIRGMLGRTLRAASGMPAENAIVLGTLSDLRRAGSPFTLAGTLAPDGYWLKTITANGRQYTVITAQNDRGVLYGAFGLLRKLGLGETVKDLDEKQSPSMAIRWVNEWNNLDGTIERGYGGRSMFWENGSAREHLDRVRDYARMLASLGINGCAINNVNADPRVLSSEMIPQLARIAETFRP